MVYGFISSLDDETTKAFFRSKRIPANNIYSTGGLGALAEDLKTGDVVYVISCNRFSSVRQVYTFARFWADRGIILHFVAEPYLDIGNGKTWRPAVASTIASMVESEQKAKQMMVNGFKMNDSQWEYTFRCFEMMNLDILSHIFSADGVLKRGSWPAWGIAPTLEQDALRLVLLSLVVTTATMVSQLKTVRITALKNSSYSYWIRNYGCTGGFCSSSSYFMELCVWCNWNLVCWTDLFMVGLLIGVDVMNKKTRAVDEATFKLIIATMRSGFVMDGVSYHPNDRIATILVLEYNLGLRVGDILQLKVDSFVKDGSRYRLDIYEQKTDKYRNFTVPVEVYFYVRDYAYAHSIPAYARLFPITKRAVLKHLQVVCKYLNLDGVGSHSFRKGFATNVYVNNHYNIELVRTLLQHSSVTVTQRYIGIGSKELEDAIAKNVCLG